MVVGIVTEAMMKATMRLKSMLRCSVSSVERWMMSPILALLHMPDDVQVCCAVDILVRNVDFGRDEWRAKEWQLHHVELQ